MFEVNANIGIRRRNALLYNFDKKKIKLEKPYEN